MPDSQHHAWRTPVLFHVRTRLYFGYEQHDLAPTRFLRTPRRPRPEAGRLSHERRRRHDHLCRQGHRAPQPRPVLLPVTAPQGSQDAGARQAHRRFRGHPHRHRVGSADPRERADQEVPAEVQRPAQGQQDLPVHPDHERGMAARHQHPPHHQRRQSVLRAVHLRRIGPQDDQPAQPALPVPQMRQEDHRQRRRLPLLPHEAMHRALHQCGGSPDLHEGDRFGVPLPLRPR